MCLKNSDEELTPAVTLRRSPRFTQITLCNPITPKPEQKGRSRLSSSATPLTITGKKNISPRKRINRSKSKECCEKLCITKQCPENSKTRSGRPTRLNPSADTCNAEKSSRSSDWRNRELENRVTSCRDVDKNDKKASYGGFTGNLSNGCASGEDKPNRLKDKSLKNKVKQSKKSSNSKSGRSVTLALAASDMNGKILSVTKKPVLDEELLAVKRTNGVTVSTAIVVHETPIDGRYVNQIQKVKRTRDQFENAVEGWTKDQETALERAYLEAKPTPHFWKKVSRLVPGKSAQECFDKIHSCHSTPPQPRTCSRARVTNSQSPFSASKLLNSSSPKAKRPRSYRQKSHVIQRNVRHMLQKQQQNSEADLFSVLEPTFTPSLNRHLLLTTPDRNQEMEPTFQERSLTAHKKSLSRLGGSTLVSPPVLKQVKNKALHEKYIDKLHCREANRKAAFAKAEKIHNIEENSSAKRKDAIKAAKNVLAYDARDAIKQFQHQQVTALRFDDDVEEDNAEGLF